MLAVLYCSAMHNKAQSVKTPFSRLAANNALAVHGSAPDVLWPTNMLCLMQSCTRQS